MFFALPIFTIKGKTQRARYAASPAGKTKFARYKASPKGKASRARSYVSPKRKASQARYESSIKAKVVKRLSSTKRRAIKHSVAICDFTKEQWIALQEQFNHRCAYCGKRAKGHLTQDHITPLSKGGNHTLSNIVPSCRSCNTRKHTKGPNVPVQPLLLDISGT